MGLVNIFRTEPQVVALSLTLPSGDYALSARVLVENLSGASQVLGCRLSTGDESFATVAYPASEAVNLQDAVTLAAPTTVTIACDHGNFVAPGFNAPALGIANSAVLTAISVDGVN